MLSLKHAPNGYFRRVVWTDICNNVLPATVRKANAQALAQKGGAGWMSSDAKHESVNMRGSKKDLVLAGKECTRVYWMPVLARGELHLELLGSAFAGDNSSGMPGFVRKPRSPINAGFRADQPGTAFVDLGGGFSQGGNVARALSRLCVIISSRLSTVTTQVSSQGMLGTSGHTRQPRRG